MDNHIRIKDGFCGERAFVLPPACIDDLQRHPLSQILHITDIGYYPNAANHYRQRLKPIGQYVFIYCVSGAGWYSVNGRKFSVQKDSYFILPPNQPHSYGADSSEPWTIYWIHFNGSLAPQYLPPASGPVELKPAAQSRIADRLEIFEEIMTTLENGFDRENLLYACSIFHHFLGSLRFITNYRNNKPATTESDKPNDMVEAAIHFMNENIGRKIKLRDIAEYTGYSPTQLSAIFSKTVGMSPVAYLNSLKIKFACRLLEFSDLKVNQICHKIGIADQYYFSRLFAKTMGMSPTDYRSHEHLNLPDM